MTNKIDPKALNDNRLLSLFNEKVKLLKSEKKFVEDKEHKLSTQLPNLMSGDVGDINKIIWPYFFSTPVATLAPTTSLSRFISISQEAFFVWTKLARVVFERVEVAPAVFEWNYIDPNDFQDGIAEDLTVEFSDAQSSRSFFFNPSNINHFGHGQEPTALDSPMMIPSNNNIEVKYFNNSASRTYVPFFTFFGYRVRVKDSQEILGLVQG